MPEVTSSSEQCDPAIDIFSSYEAWEIIRLRDQDWPELQPLAYEELKKRMNYYLQEAERAAELDDRLNLRRRYHIGVTVLSGISVFTSARYGITNMADLTMLAFGGYTFSHLLNAKKIKKERQDIHPKALEATKYLLDILENHPCRPVRPETNASQ